MSQQITFTFNKATDTIGGRVGTPQNQLVYSCYKSSEEINTLAKIDALGILVETATDVNTFTIGGLGNGEQVYFNVVVRDLAGRRTAYRGSFELTDPLPQPWVQFISEDTFLNVGNSTQLSWIIEVGGTLTDSVTFSSSQPGVVSVSSTGVVTGVTQSDPLNPPIITVRSVADTTVFDTILVGVDTYEFTPLEEATIQTFTTII